MLTLGICLKRRLNLSERKEQQRMFNTLFLLSISCVRAIPSFVVRLLQKMFNALFLSLKLCGQVARSCIKFNTLFLLVILSIQVIPSFIGHIFNENTASDLYYIADHFVIILLSLYIYKEIPFTKTFNKLISMLLMVVGMLFIVNYLAAEGLTHIELFNYINERGNG